MIETLRQSAEALLEQAHRGGAERAQVAASHQVVSRVAYEKNDFNISSANTHVDLGLEVHREQRKGSASTNEAGAASLADVAGRALALARFSLEDPYLTLPGPQLPEPFPGRYDESLAALAPEDLHALAAAFVASAKEEQRLSLDVAEVEVTTVHEVLANSHGLHVEDRVTRVDWSLMGMGKTETEVTSFDYLSGSSWSWGAARESAQRTARELAHKLVATLGARAGETYKGAVLLGPGVVGDLLIGPIAFQISGRQIMDGKSRWADALGQSVAASCLTLTDNPFNLALSGATPYDEEGVAVRLTPIIAGGVLETHVDSTYTAGRRGTSTTGHAGGLHGVELDAGERTRDSLLAAAERVVLVERFSGNVDPVSGDFSGVAKNSHYYKNGQHQHPLSETMIAGNVFDLLRQIVAFSDHAEPWCNSYQAPHVLVDGVSVTAA